MSDPTSIDGNSPGTRGEPKTIIEGGGGTPADGRTLVEQSGTPSGQSSIGIHSVNLAPGVQIAGCILREQLRVISGEADLWVAEQPGRQGLAVLKVFRWGVRPKTEVAEKLRSIPKAQIVEVLGNGVLSDGRHYELLEYIQGGTLANLMQPGGVSPSLARQILMELAEALTEIHAAGILHRDLKPSNILIRHREPLDLVLTDFGISSLCDQTSLYVTTAHRTAAYSAPEAMTGVIGSSSDWWSVGVMLLELLAGRHPFAGMDERIVNFQLVSRGIEVPASLPEEWKLLLKGLLTRDHQKRWSGEQVRAWLAGQRDIPVFYQTGPQQAVEYKPYKFLGKNCGTPAELAREAGQAKNWDEGVKSLQRRYIQDWVKQDVRDFDLLSKLQDIEDDKNLDWKQKLGAALLVLDPELPLCWRGEIVTHDWISAQATHGAQQLNNALALLTSSLPEWLQRCRDQAWMLEVRQRRQRVQTEVGRLGLNLPPPDVDKVIFLPFEAVSTEAKRRKEVAYGAAEEADEPLNAVLKKPQWDEAECIAVVACPFSRFLTKEQHWLEVKTIAEAEADGLFQRARANSDITELHALDSLFLKLGDSLERDFNRLSQPMPFDRRDDQLRERIEEGSRVCRQRIHAKRKALKLVFASALSIFTACAVFGLHIWLLGKTSLSFVFSLDGKDLPPNKTLHVTVDGKPFAAGDKITLGNHQLAVSFPGGESFARTVRTFYGKSDLGVLPLESSKGSLSILVKPSPATVIVQKDGKVFQQGDAPLKIAQLPVGDYSLLIRRGKYEESSSLKIERQQLAEASIILNLGGAQLSSEPPDAEFEFSGNGQHWQGKLPAHIDDVPVGTYQFSARRKEWELNKYVTVKRDNLSTNKIEFEYGSLEVTSDPPGLSISMDGVEVGKTQTTLHELKPGQYALTVTDGESDLRANVTVGPKEAAKHAFDFHYGAVQLASSPPGATVIRKGKEVGKTPLTLARILAETTTVELRLDGYLSTNVALLTRPGLTTNYTVRLVSERYLKALNQAREALHNGQFTQSHKLLFTALSIHPNDSAAIQLQEEVVKAVAKAAEALRIEQANAKPRALQTAEALRIEQANAAARALQTAKALRTEQANAKAQALAALPQLDSGASVITGQTYKFDSSGWKITRIEKDGTIVFRTSGSRTSLQFGQEEIRAIPAAENRGEFLSVKDSQRIIIKAKVKTVDHGDFFSRVLKRIILEDAELLPQ